MGVRNIFRTLKTSSLQENAEQAVREMLKGVVKRVAGSDFAKHTKEKEVVLEARDYMDDGSMIQLRLTIDGEKGEADFDFTGTSPEVRCKSCWVFSWLLGLRFPSLCCY